MSKVDKNYQLKKASFSDLPVIQNLAMFYRYDLSEYTKWPCDDKGVYRCEGLAFYLKDENLSYLIYVNDELAGFVLIEVHSQSSQYEIGEFFIVRQFRGLGIAKAVATEIFECFKGQWIIKQLAVNKPAINFWKKILLDSCEKVEIHFLSDKEYGEICHMSFTNKK